MSLKQQQQQQDSYYLLPVIGGIGVIIKYGWNGGV